MRLSAVKAILRAGTTKPTFAAEVGTRNVVKRGLNDEESGLAAFREVARAEHNSGQCKLYVSWHLWVAVK